MAKPKRHKSGEVVWVRNVPDRSGAANAKPRPLLVIKPDPLSTESPLCCLGISTRPGDDPTDPAIEMPWDATNGSTTGLYEWCRVVLLWHVQVEQADVVEASGVVTGAFLENVLGQREQAKVWQLGRKGK